MGRDLRQRGLGVFAKFALLANHFVYVDSAMVLQHAFLEDVVVVVVLAQLLGLHR